MGSPSLCLVLVLLFLLLPSSLSQTTFVFGDSLVDAGNNDYIFTLSKANSPPYGIDFALSGGRPTGRFTNGRTIADIIGQAMGDKSFPPPYLAPNSHGSKIFRGINYASGASGILDDTGSLFIGRVPLGRQMSYFEDTRNHMNGLVGEDATTEFLKRAVFSITTGSNDILNYIEPSIPFFGKAKGSPSDLQDLMISNLTSHLKRLHKLGARKFIVVGVGPLGCIPYVRAIKFVADRRCSLAVNRLIQGYNMKLNSTIWQLNQEMGPEAMFIYANSYGIVAEIIQNYKQYGFENANDPCCGGSFPPFFCIAGSNNTGYILCEDRSKYVFWDAYHPTEAANIIIAEKLLDGDASAASPINVRKLYDYAS